MLQGVPQLQWSQRNEARRLVTLLDTLYDMRCHLHCSAAGKPHQVMDHPHISPGPLPFSPSVFPRRSKQYGDPTTPRSSSMVGSVQPGCALRHVNQAMYVGNDKTADWCGIIRLIVPCNTTKLNQMPARARYVWSKSELARYTPVQRHEGENVYKQ